MVVPATGRIEHSSALMPFATWHGTSTPVMQNNSHRIGARRVNRCLSYAFLTQRLSTRPTKAYAL